MSSLSDGFFITGDSVSTAFSLNNDENTDSAPVNREQWLSESGFLKVYIGGETKKSMPDIISDQASMASLENGSTR